VLRGGALAAVDFAAVGVVVGEEFLGEFDGVDLRAGTSGIGTEMVSWKFAQIQSENIGPGIPGSTAWSRYSRI
jgi:hypothetical protein